MELIDAQFAFVIRGMLQRRVQPFRYLVERRLTAVESTREIAEPAASVVRTSRADPERDENETLDPAEHPQSLRFAFDYRYWKRPIAICSSTSMQTLRGVAYFS
ncbi:hypothetical protein [Paraburkholderia dilworthii]|uniref:hypothetical protein n=1 Tax=Paraburkholderia dilworthii TaxID=948106 RepID=UPI000488A024|nr:hypothetical protein [Paraburkholderia dilworthii]